MCGFLISKGFQLTEELERYCAMLLSYRGPDSLVVYNEEAVEFKVMFARLVVTGDADHGRQPSLDDGKVRVFNGEIYNYLSFVKEKGEGISDRLSDTEVLFSLLKEHDFLAGIEMADGMYAVVEVSEDRRVCELAVDMFSQKPLYYHCSEAGYIISSSLRAIDAILRSKYDCKDYNWKCYDTLGYYFGNTTPNKAINRCCSRVTIEIQEESDTPEYEAHRTSISYSILLGSKDRFRLQERPSYCLGSENKLFESFSELLSQTIDVTFPHSGAVAVAFSGGFDSTLLVAELVCKGHAPKLYTVGFPSSPSFDETQNARAAAAMFPKLPHKIVHWSSDEFFDNYNDYMRGMDAPIADMSFLSTSFLFKNISDDGIRVTLGGDGLDELSCGYPSVIADSLTHRIPAHPIFGLLAHLVPKRENGLDFPFLRNLKALLETLSIDSIHLRHLTWAHYSTDIDTYTLSTLLQEINPDLSSTPTHLLDMWTYLPGMLMRKLDQASMNFSVEARLPFLQGSIPAFLAALPKEYHFQSFKGKYFLKKYMIWKHNIDFTNVKKHGFGTPIVDIVRDKRFKQLVMELNDCLESNGYEYRISNPSDKIYVRDSWHSFVKGYWMSAFAK